MCVYAREIGSSLSPFSDAKCCRHAADDAHRDGGTPCIPAHEEIQCFRILRISTRPLRSERNRSA